MPSSLDHFMHLPLCAFFQPSEFIANFIRTRYIPFGCYVVPSLPAWSLPVPYSKSPSFTLEVSNASCYFLVSLIGNELVTKSHPVGLESKSPWGLLGKVFFPNIKRFWREASFAFGQECVKIWCLELRHPPCDHDESQHTDDGWMGREPKPT